MSAVRHYEVQSYPGANKTIYMGACGAFNNDRTKFTRNKPAVTCKTCKRTSYMKTDKPEVPK